MRRAFTLIELLVVISILSLLIAITLPALSNARHQAKLTLCLSQMRGVSQSVTIYATDHKDYYPDGPRGRQFPTNIAENRGGSEAASSYDLRDGLRTYLGTHKLSEMLVCPMTAEGWWSLQARADRRQIDTMPTSPDRLEIPYLLYFGQNATNSDGSYNLSGYDQWGRVKEMLRGGDYFVPDWRNGGNTPEFDILMSDTLARATHGEQVTMASHYPFGGGAPIGLNSSGIYGTYRVPLGLEVTGNYARTDGSAKTYIANFNSMQGNQFMGFDGADGGVGPHVGQGPMLPADMAR